MMSIRHDWLGKPELTLIIGCGRLGSTLASTLSNESQNVILIDRQAEAFRKLSPSYGDAANVEVLKQAQIEKADHLVIVTNHDNTNILIAQLARELFQVPHVICRLYDPQRECVYREFGIQTICPTTLSSQAIEQRLQAKATADQKGSDTL